MSRATRTNTPTLAEVPPTQNPAYDALRVADQYHTAVSLAQALRPELKVSKEKVRAWIKALEAQGLIVRRAMHFVALKENESHVLEQSAKRLAAYLAQHGDTHVKDLLASGIGWSTGLLYHIIEAQYTIRIIATKDSKVITTDCLVPMSADLVETAILNHLSRLVDPWGQPKPESLTNLCTVLELPKNNVQLAVNQLVDAGKITIETGLLTYLKIVTSAALPEQPSGPTTEADIQSAVAPEPQQPASPAPTCLPLRRPRPAPTQRARWTAQTPRNSHSPQNGQSACTIQRSRPAPVQRGRRLLHPTWPRHGPPRQWRPTPAVPRLPSRPRRTTPHLKGGHP